MADDRITKLAGHVLLCLWLLAATLAASELKVNSQDYLHEQGMDVLLHHNAYHEVFFDQKLGGLEIILYGERIATDGEVRLSPTPEQWDPLPQFKERKRTGAGLVSRCSYASQGLSYRVEVSPEAGGGFTVAVHLDQPLPAALEGKAGFNLEFLPAAYFGKTFLADGRPGIFPRHPVGQMHVEEDGKAEPLPIASGDQLVLAPEDDYTRVSIKSDSGRIMLFDGRNKAQNGWFVVRTLIPSNRTANAIVWHVRPKVIPGWVRPPVVSYNQVGYTPERSKVAVIELDPAFSSPQKAAVLRITPGGEYQQVFAGAVLPWGKWMRYQYAHFDFTPVREPGIYVIEYAGRRTGPFRIEKNLYRTGVWQASLDTYLPVQMDHMKVREQYRIWHGASHMDDARQAPVNHVHFDGYSMGAATDSPYQPGEHIPGLNVGGWHDAGDFDLRTQTQANVINQLAFAREEFGLDWDQTTIDQQSRQVQIRKPDGKPDVLQQVEHGVLAILAQYKAIGHSIPGIIEPTLQEYTHIGDPASQTDGRVYSSRLGAPEADGNYSALPDDRWAFTTHTTPLEYEAISALASASRVLRGYNDDLANECLSTAVGAWNKEQKDPPAVATSFNTAGGDLEDQEIVATVSLLMATNGAEVYRKRLHELEPKIHEHFLQTGAIAVRAIPLMDSSYKEGLAAATRKFKATIDRHIFSNPFGVPIMPGNWGGSGMAAGFAAHLYILHKAFPEIIGPEYTFRGFDYVLGRHPASNVSYVSTVGTQSRLLAYGSNRADYSFIPGGMIPGIVIVRPDLPELQEKWPFLWFENEYVVDAVTTFIVAANAADALTR